MYTSRDLAYALSLIGAYHVAGDLTDPTLDFVRASCQRDGLPDYIIRLVLERVVAEIAAGAFPVVLPTGRIEWYD